MNANLKKIGSPISKLAKNSMYTKSPGKISAHKDFITKDRMQVYAARSPLFSPTITIGFVWIHCHRDRFFCTYVPLPHPIERSYLFTMNVHIECTWTFQLSLCVRQKCAFAQGAASVALFCGHDQTDVRHNYTQRLPQNLRNCTANRCNCSPRSYPWVRHTHTPQHTYETHLVCVCAGEEFWFVITVLSLTCRQIAIVFFSWRPITQCALAAHFVYVLRIDDSSKSVFVFVGHSPIAALILSIKQNNNITILQRWMFSLSLSFSKHDTSRLVVLQHAYLTCSHNTFALHNSVGYAHAFTMQSVRHRAEKKSHLDMPCN